MFLFEINKHYQISALFDNIYIILGKACRKEFFIFWLVSCFTFNNSFFFLTFSISRIKQIVFPYFNEKDLQFIQKKHKYFFMKRQNRWFSSSGFLLDILGFILDLQYKVINKKIRNQTNESQRRKLRLMLSIISGSHYITIENPELESLRARFMERFMKQLVRKNFQRKRETFEREPQRREKRTNKRKHPKKKNKIRVRHKWAQKRIVQNWMTVTHFLPPSLPPFWLKILIFPSSFFLYFDFISLPQEEEKNKNIKRIQANKKRHRTFSVFLLPCIDLFSILFFSPFKNKSSSSTKIFFSTNKYFLYFLTITIFSMLFSHLYFSFYFPSFRFLYSSIEWK